VIWRIRKRIVKKKIGDKINFITSIDSRKEKRRKNKLHFISIFTPCHAFHFINKSYFPMIISIRIA